MRLPIRFIVFLVPAGLDVERRRLLAAIGTYKCTQAGTPGAPAKGDLSDECFFITRRYPT
jgi:hypothetical protein